MIIREPQVHATLYYSGRGADRPAFDAEAQRVMTLLAGWLALPTPPEIPPLADADAAPADRLAPLLEMDPIVGRTNASARVAVYRLRGLLLLRVVLARPGDHETGVWSMMEEALGPAPAAATWLSTARYWSAMAPRPPEELERDHMAPLKTAFGVLCLGRADHAHLLVYPDARTEARAAAFLRADAPALDSYPVEARVTLGRYADHASQMARQQQQALDRLTQAAQTWGAPRGGLGVLAPTPAELDTLQTTYDDLLGDLQRTRGHAQLIRALGAEYRYRLIDSGLWDAGPSVWEAQLARLDGMAAQIEGDVQHLDASLRQIDVIGRSLQTRSLLLLGERERLLILIVGLLGLAGLVVLVADTDPRLMLVRLLALALLGGGLWLLYRRWQPPQGGG